VIQAATILGRAGCSGVVYRLPTLRDHDLEPIRADLAEVVDEYIGETERNLVRVFDAVEGTNEVVLFAEADGLFGQRAKIEDGDHKI
jgi:SpoVK/Ycf46/Vps4 family AAA+-type ATPase